MPKHNVYLDLPLREVNKVDAHFHIFRDDAKMGRITVSKGATLKNLYGSDGFNSIKWLKTGTMVKETLFA